MKKFILFFVTLAITSFAIITGCKKDKTDDITPTDPTKTTIVLSGAVIDVNQAPLSGVTVKIGSLQTVTETDGSFYFSSVTVSKDRFVVEFSKTGYFSLNRSAIPEAGVPIDMEVGLISETDFTYAGSKSFSSTISDSLEMSSGCVVSFLANSFVTSTGAAYTGMVNVKAAYLDPTMTNFPMFVFGGDLYGKDNAGNDVMLNPFTGLNVIITDPSGNKLQLDEANAIKATVRMQIPNSLLLSAPASIDLLEYNPIMGVSQSSGTANKTGGKYMGQVGHFSFWSCQVTTPGIAVISGRVTDSNGLPVPGVNVRVGHTMAKTNINGDYIKKVPTGVAMVIGIFPTYYGTVINPIPCTALSDGQTFTADFTVPAMRKVYGRLVNCAGAPIVGRVAIDWYSYTTYTNVHTSCFTQNDGVFELFMETSATSANIHAWGNGTDTIKYFYPSTDPYNYGDFVLCPPVQLGPTRLILNGGQFSNVTLNGFNGSRMGKLIYDTAGVARHIQISAYGSDGDLYIQTNGVHTGQYTVGTKSTPTIVSMYIMSTTPYFQDTLSTGTVNITKIGGENVGLIEGTITGVSSTGVNVSGQFSVPRGPNQYN